MANSISQLLDLITEDPWRQRVGFSTEIEEANRLLFNENIPETQMAAVFNKWLRQYQPCIFGRIAAANNWISYCILREKELLKSDEEIRDTIQNARRAWRKAAFQGGNSAFIIAAVSPRIAAGVPDNVAEQIALRLCSLYLLTDVQPDRIYLDEIFLELESRGRPTWRWNVGANYFSAQGDKRWWNDHRFPGGMAFSMNSVGHMVKSTQMGRAVAQMERVMGVGLDNDPWATTKVDSLEKALEYAMRTIDNASDTVSGKATHLTPLPDDAEGTLPACPVNLSGELAKKNFCTYEGRYHTDHTVPSEYFRRDVERPVGLPTHELDFTYLFHGDVENPDFYTTGAGLQIRTDLTPEEYQQRRIIFSQKSLRSQGEEVTLTKERRLALGLDD
jgi:hypothetical protein